MKKILLLLFVLFAVNLSAQAVLTTEDAVSEAYLTNHGYSSEMARLIDLQSAQANGINVKYKRKQPDWYTTNKKVNFVRNVFMYFDSGIDDEKFMQHEIKYSNRWDCL
jgi:hypothetical protein